MSDSFRSVGIAVYQACKFILIIGLLFSQAACQEQGGETAKLVQTFKLSYSPTKVAWHPDGKRIAIVGMGGILSVFDTVTGQPLQTPSMWASSFSVAYSPDGRLLALQKSTNDRKQDYPAQSLVVLDANSHAVIYESESSIAVQYHVNAFDPSGRYLIVTDYNSRSGYTMVFDMVEKKQVAKLVVAIPSGRGADTIEQVVFSPDGSRVIGGTLSGALNVWSTKDWHLIKTFKAHKGYVLAMAISPDGKWLATGSNSGGIGERFDPVTHAKTETKYDDPIKIWDTSSWEQVKALPIRDKHIRSMAFFPDGRHLVSAAGENIVFWDVPTEKKIGEVTGGIWDRVKPKLLGPVYEKIIMSLALSKDGKNLAVVRSGSSEAQVWKIVDQLNNREKKITVPGLALTHQRSVLPQRITVFSSNIPTF
jgi:WD40 repeat protein